MAQTSIFSTLFPPSPTFKPASLPSQLNRVTIITGAASGVGFELAKILYSCDATVYVCARSLKRCNEAIEKIKSETKGPKLTSEMKGKLEAMVVDLADLRTVKPAVEAFLAKESRLDVLVHNAGVMTPPKGSKDVHVSLAGIAARSVVIDVVLSLLPTLSFIVIVEVAY
jgi:retinol dehydrogenase-12